MDPSLYESLTPRERECLRLARDLPTKEIARATQLAPNTVDTYIRRATEKLGVNRRQAARLVAEYESCPQGFVSQFSRLPNDDQPNDQGLADRSLPPARQPDAVHEERVPFDFGPSVHVPRHADPTDRQWGNRSSVPAAFWIIAIAALIMLLIIGSVPMADSMGKIGRLIYSHN